MHRYLHTSSTHKYYIYLHYAEQVRTVSIAVWCALVSGSWCYAPPLRTDWMEWCLGVLTMENWGQENWSLSLSLSVSLCLSVSVSLSLSLSLSLFLSL